MTIESSRSVLSIVLVLHVIQTNAKIGKGIFFGKTGKVRQKDGIKKQVIYYQTE
jgi:hypothetical protein